MGKKEKGEEKKSKGLEKKNYVKVLTPDSEAFNGAHAIGCMN